MPICAFCGRDVAKVTRDHVPPESLFGKKPNFNLITVPSCRDCNGGTSKDDEYFKLLAVEWEASAHPTAASVMASVGRSLLRPQAAKYRNHLLRNTTLIDLFTPAGLYIKPGGQLNVSVGRLVTTATKVVKGLYYHHQGRSVPDGYFAYCNFLDFILTGWPQPFVRETEEAVLPVLTVQPATVIGPEVFCYRVCGLEGDPNVMFFLWELYNRYQFFGFIARKADSGERETTTSGCSP